MLVKHNSEPQASSPDVQQERFQDQLIKIKHESRVSVEHTPKARKRKRKHSMLKNDKNSALEDPVVEKKSRIAVDRYSTPYAQ